MSEKITLTVDEAIACLPDGDSIHTFITNRSIVGATWTRDRIIAHIREHGGAEIAGPMARKMGHGICLDAARRLFCEHDEAKLSALETT